MSEPLRKPAPALEAPRTNALSNMMPPVRTAEVNDNQIEAAPRAGEQRGFEVPPVMWAAMIACYAVFLGALLAATGSPGAAFVIAISAVYVAMFFGTARALVRQAPPQAQSPLARSGGRLQTLYGPLGRGAVAAQLLVVPGAIALFGITVLLIRLSVA